MTTKIATPIEARLYVELSNTAECDQVERMAIACGLINLSGFWYKGRIPKNAEGKAEVGYELYEGRPTVEWGWFGGSKAVVEAFAGMAKAHGFESRVELHPFKSLAESADELSADELLFLEAVYSGGDLTNPQARSILDRVCPSYQGAEVDEIQVGMQIQSILYMAANK